MAQAHKEPFRNERVTMEWKNDRIVKIFSKDNEGSEISKSHNVQRMLFLKI